MRVMTDIFVDTRFISHSHTVHQGSTNQVPHVQRSSSILAEAHVRGRSLRLIRIAYVNRTGGCLARPGSRPASARAAGACRHAAILLLYILLQIGKSRYQALTNEKTANFMGHSPYSLQ